MKRFKKRVSEFLAVFLSGALVLCPTSAFAAEQETNTPKEEVVYINLNADGSVKEINVVNIFDLDGDGRIVDYGRYESVRNMTTTNEIGRSDDMITIDAKAGKLYYEGKLSDNVMPWNIEIHYFMDGKEYSGEEIAGMSGSLKLTMDITENKQCEGGFFDGYALQASITLDTGRCKNIQAPDATIANVGSDKQLTYTILPGKGANLEITADVTDFEMSGVSVNGIPLNLNVEVDDEEIMDQITELLDAIEQLDDGAGELQDGVSELQDGAQTDLKSGVSELQDGSGKLYDGTGELKDGGSSLKSGAAELQDGADSLDEGIQSLNDGIGQIQSALNELNAQSYALTGGSAEFKAALTKLQEALDGISVTSEDLSALISASSEIKTGIDALLNGAGALQQSVSFDAYKAVMAQNGLDIDALRENNASVIAGLQTTIEGLQEQAAAAEEAGEDVSALEAQIGQLSEIATLLGANDAALTGTESYLAAVGQSLSALLEGSQNLQTGYAAFDESITRLAGALGELAPKMTELSSAVDTLVQEYEKIDSGIAGYTGAVAQITEGCSKVTGGAAGLAKGSGELVSGSKELYGGTSELLSGIVELYDGAGTLYDGTGELDEGVAELLTGIAALYDGTGELKDGTSTMREETSGMDTQITDKIDELLESITGGDMEVESFVSDKNTEVEAVQFVIQTEGIAEEEAVEVVTEQTESLSFWQKLLRLFGVE